MRVLSVVALLAISVPAAADVYDRHAIGDQSHVNFTPRHRSDVTILGGRPAACAKFSATKHRYCGCASAAYAGLPNDDGRWNRARAWYALPRAAPGPGMAWIKPGGTHVAIIIGGGPGAWKLYDPNSGGGLTRIRIRDLSRGTIVNPRGA